MGKVYFASDFHLGIDTSKPSRAREKMICQWLEVIRTDADTIYLVGDMFDFWFEYKQAVPRGHIRFLGKLAELRDDGIEIIAFTGNHDMWLFDYFPTELDIPIFRDQIQRTIGGKRFFIGHGDGKGPGDRGYKWLKKLFASRLCQWLFARLHPNFGIGLANFLSRRSRRLTTEETYLGEENEWLVQYANRKLDQFPDTDYFIFGHRHLPLDITLKNKKSRYINLGDWMNHFTYAVFDGREVQLKTFHSGTISS
jgi:UDP-2,3-diacylglucosamine hydrolase